MSLNPLSKSVFIRNPVQGSAYTSRKRAIQYVQDGQARFVGPGMNEIEFVEDCHQRRSVVASAIPATAGCRATFDEIKHLPVAGRDSVQRITANRRTPRRTPGQQRAASRLRLRLPRAAAINAIP